MKKIIEGYLYNRIEKLGNQDFKHVGFEDNEGKFGEYLEEMVPIIGSKKKAKLTIEILENDFNRMLDKKYVYAIIGANDNQEKYGYKVLKNLKEAGYKVIPINPHKEKILGLKVYNSILKVNKKIDVVIFVVPPMVTRKILKQVKKGKINKVWMQPGSESEENINYCQKNKILYIAKSCIIINNLK